jgi:hypothetical protein
MHAHHPFFCYQYHYCSLTPEAVPLVNWELEQLQLYVQPSTIKGTGRGLFTKEVIEPGKVVGVFWGAYVAIQGLLEQCEPKSYFCLRKNVIALPLEFQPVVQSADTPPETAITMHLVASECCSMAFANTNAPRYAVMVVVFSLLIVSNTQPITML